ncbi:hypothetical protein ColLi_09070 [Colletotrichum liriopes]|uniref:Uncharacterized protein n=1 Tax=Colletotrichum liriopes TaxID=708192 RepID=A0AA37LVQ0_9PEZI|nr:hypothetical protein ColLi_09070 [Colletotrichum liriopes]
MDVFVSPRLTEPQSTQALEFSPDAAPDDWGLDYPAAGVSIDEPCSVSLADIETEIDALRSQQASTYSPSLSASFYLACHQLPALRQILSRYPGFRFYYDAARGHVHIMVESVIHQQCTKHAVTLLERCVQAIAAATTELVPNVAKRFDNIAELGTVTIDVPGLGLSQPDAQFLEDGCRFPTFVVETAFSQSIKSATEKAKKYITRTTGAVRAVLVVDVDYPDIRRIDVVLWVAKRVDGRAAVAKPFKAQTVQLYVADAEVQPEGAIELFASDFLEPDAAWPRQMRRPYRRMRPGGEQR